MNIKEYMETLGKAYSLYKQQQIEEGIEEKRIDKTFDRAALIGLNNLHCTEEELIKVICTFVDEDYAEGTQLEYLQPLLHKLYLLSVDYDKENKKPIVKEYFKCYLDLNSGMIASYNMADQWGVHTKKTVVAIQNYEKFGEKIDKKINWYDLVAETID